MTLTALPITSAGGFWPLGPLGMARFLRRLDERFQLPKESSPSDLFDRVAFSAQSLLEVRD